MAVRQQATIFITEAAPHQADRLAGALGAAGYQTQVGSEAGSLTELLKVLPDLVVVQVAGPQSGGYGLCRQMKADLALATVPVVFAGLFDTPESRAEVFAAGGVDYVTLPPAVTWPSEATPEATPEMTREAAFDGADVVARVTRQLELRSLGESGEIAPDSPRLPLLKASLQRLHNSLDLDTILHTAVRDVRQQTQADRVVIYQFRNDGRGIVTHEATADPALSILHQQVEDACFDRDHALTYWTGRVGQINDVMALGPVSQCYRNMLLGFGIRANLVIPVIHNLMGQTPYLWGLLILHQCHQPRRWQTDEIGLLQEIAAHLAIAIQQSRLFEQVRRQARQEMLLNHILDEIRASLDVRHILACTVEHLRSALNLRHCGITLIRHALASLPTPFMATVQDPALTAPLPPLPITDLLRQQLQLDGNVLVAPYLGNTMETRPPIVHPVVQDHEAYVATAIRTDSQVQGVLWACPHPASPETTGEGRWEPSDLRLVEEVALQLSQALHQAGLYQQLQVANDELQRLAHLDGLTQIANRREFDRYLAQEWQRLQREQGSLTLVLADVDYFKGYNDSYGHLAGDDCLRTIGRLLGQVTKRPADLAARYGGEEFALILPNTTAAGAIALTSEAQTYLARLSLPNQASSLYGQVTLSFGIATVVPSLSLSTDQLIKQADQALYAAKESGRNRYCLWSEAIESAQGHSPPTP